MARPGSVPTRARFIALAALAAALIVSSCSNKSGTTYPTTGGGGGGVVADPFNSGVFTNGRFVHTFATAGDFGYHCLVHGNAMRGTVHVANGLADSAKVNITDPMSYAPVTINVKPGGYVWWVASGSAHSVTTP
jgi:plastocyanin